MNKPPTIIFTQDSPFFEMVMAFLAATMGLGPVFEKENPLSPGPDKIAWYRGKVRPDLAIDVGQVHALRLSGDLTADAVMKSLCCMLLNTAYSVADAHNDQSPEFEVFRHLRNAAAHGNNFFFKKDEPRRPASWGSVCDRRQAQRKVQSAIWRRVHRRHYFSRRCPGLAAEHRAPFSKESE